MGIVWSQEYWNNSIKERGAFEMKIGKKLLVLSLSCLMIMSQFNRVHASEELTGRNLKQRSLEVVENMPNISSHYKILDWAKRGKD